MNTRLATNEQLLDDLMDEKVVYEESRLQSPSLTCANPGTSSGTIRRGAMTSPRHADHDTVPDIADEVLARVTSCLRVTSALDLPTMDDELGSEEEVTTPAPKRKGLTLSKICTADTTVLRKIIWAHEVVYTSAGQPAVYEDYQQPQPARGKAQRRGATFNQL